jgi:hypothetical protein
MSRRSYPYTRSQSISPSEPEGPLTCGEPQASKLHLGVVGRMERTVEAVSAEYVFTPGMGLGAGFVWP